MEEHIKTLLPMLNEKQRRLFLASCVKMLGRGGLNAVSEMSGASRHTIIRGLRELDEGAEFDISQIRRPGSGRKKIKANKKSWRI